MGFDSYHPAIHFLFFAGVIAAAATFDQPVFLALSYLCPVAYSIALSGKKAVAFQAVLGVCVVLWTAWYANYNHFGVTSLGANWIGNPITLEALVSGFVLGIRAAAVLTWVFCVHRVVTGDQVVYLFGRMTPRLALLLAIGLRMVPVICAQAKKINEAQKCVGRGANQGNPAVRLHNCLRIFSILLTWLPERLTAMSDSMGARGGRLRGRSAYSIYRFDHRDRGLVLTLFFCVTVLTMGVLLNQTHIPYNPAIVMNRLTPLSFCFYGAYALLCLLPVLLERWGALRWKNTMRA